MARFSHGITVLPATHARTITVYWPATEHHCHLAGTQCAYPQRDGQAELTWVAGSAGTNVSATEKLSKCNAKSQRQKDPSHS